MPLLPTSAFEHVFTPFRGRRLGFVVLDGNVGDALINLATVKLLIAFGIDYRHVPVGDLVDGSVTGSCDALAVSGGGNLGPLYPLCIEIRRLALDTGLPVTVLPQSCTGPDDDIERFERVFVRERASLELVGRTRAVELAPDLALGLPDPYVMQPPWFERGVFLREDAESVFDDRSLSLVDPVVNNTTPHEYLSFASCFREIVTDRMHFAIAGLIMGRRVTLLPNSYAKNRSMFDTWLSGLGCQWRDSLDGIDYPRDEIIATLWTRLAVARDACRSWSFVPRRVRGVRERIAGDGLDLVDAKGEVTARLDPAARAIWSLCDGQRDLEDVAGTLAGHFPRQTVSVALDVQRTVGSIKATGLLSKKTPGGTGRHRGQIELTVLPDRVVDSWYYRLARIRSPWGVEQLLWFAVPVVHRALVSRRADCFVLATVMLAMDRKLDLFLRAGRVADGLMENLERFQETWHGWLTHLEPVEIRVDPAVDEIPATGWALAFSGGLDSTWSLCELARAAAREHRAGGAAVMVHGFDIPLCDETGFDRAFDRARKVSEAAGVPLVPVRTNIRELGLDWEMSHGTALAAALSLLGNGFASGVIASTLPASLDSVWGSNPHTDPLLGSDSFEIVHHGTGIGRLDKLRALAGHPEAVRGLRVCWKNHVPGGNCGRCRKCILLQLALRTLELPLDAFTRPLDDESLAERVPANVTSLLDRFDLGEMAAALVGRGRETPWGARLVQYYA